MKAKLRKLIKDQRNALSYSEITLKEDKILGHLRQLDLGQHIFLYADVRQEVPTKRIRQMLWEQGKQVYLSISDFQEVTMQLYHVSEFTPLIRNSWGIEEPYSNTGPLEDTSVIDTVLIPGLAFSREGYRMGYGKGFYDRFLSKNPRAKRIGLAYGFQLLDSIPYDSWDEPLDIIVTENEIYYVKPDSPRII